MSAFEFESAGLGLDTTSTFTSSAKLSVNIGFCQSGITELGNATLSHKELDTSRTYLYMKNHDPPEPGPSQDSASFLRRLAGPSIMKAG